MNAKQFLILVNKGNSLQKEDFKALVRLHETFPYFALPKILAAKYERVNTGGVSEEILHWAAIQVPDRVRLKQLIQHPIDFLPSSTASPATVETPEESSPQPTQSLPQDEETTSPQTRGEILRRLEDNLNRFKSLSKKTEVEIASPGEEMPTPIAEDLIATIKKKEKKAILDARKKEQNKIIKAFAKKSTQTALMKENQDTANLADLSQSSTSFNDKIITESFAKLLVKQNCKGRAIEIYKKLTLKFPDKSAYFAALIKELEE